MLRKRELALRASHASATRVQHEGNVVVVDRGELTLVCNLGDEAIEVRVAGELVLASDESATRDRLPAASCMFVRR